MFEILFSPAAAAFFERADATLQKRIDRCCLQLKSDPFRHNNIKRLKGEFAGIYRFRIGEWRVMYRVDNQTRKVVIIDIGHRRDVYE
jgi:mRNA interferase RelE/StbE